MKWAWAANNPFGDDWWFELKKGTDGAIDAGLQGLERSSAAPSVLLLGWALAGCSWVGIWNTSPGLIVSMTQLTPLSSIKVHIHACTSQREAHRHRGFQPLIDPGGGGGGLPWATGSGSTAACPPSGCLWWGARWCPPRCFRGTRRGQSAQQSVSARRCGRFLVFRKMQL